MMSVLKKVLFIAAILIIIAELFILDYNDLSWKNNAGNYMVVLAMLFTLGSMLLSLRQEKKGKEDQKP